MILADLTVPEILAVAGTSVRLRSLCSGTRVLRTYRSSRMSRFDSWTVTNSSVAHMLNMAQSLHTVILDERTTCSVVQVAKHSRYLRVLQVSGDACDDSKLQIVARKCPHLRVLTAARTSISNNSLVALGKGCRNLTALEVPDSQITDSGIATIVSCFPGLRTLNVAGTKVTDVGAMMAATGLSKLQRLTVTRFERREAGLAWFAFVPPSNIGVSEACINGIRQRYRGVVVLTQKAHHCWPWRTWVDPDVYGGWRWPEIQTAETTESLDEGRRLASREVRRPLPPRQPSIQRHSKGGPRKTKHR